MLITVELLAVWDYNFGVYDLCCLDKNWFFTARLTCTTVT